MALAVIPCISLSQPSKSANVATFSGRVVVFFQPSQAEYDSHEKDESSGIDEVLDDFQFYAAKVESFLKKHKIQSQLTAQPIIEVCWGKNVFRFERSKAEQNVGMILSDGVHSPKVVYGVDTDDGLTETFKHYFKVK